MEPTLDEKIQEAIKPLVDRITTLQSENVQFKKDIAALQAANQPKTGIKPPAKPLDNHVERPTTAKGGKRPSQHQQVKPSGQPGPKKQEVKPQQQDTKTENSKVGASKPTPGSKPLPSPHSNKDLNNAKPRPTTGAGSRVGTGVPANRSGLNDKKAGTNKTLEAEQEKKEQGAGEKVEEKKIHTSKSKQKDQKTPVHGLKSPGPAKKTADKKAPVPSPAPAKKSVPAKPQPKNAAIKGGKHLPPKAQEKQEQKKEPGSQPIPDQVKVEMKSQTKKGQGIPDEIQQQSIALNNTEKVENNPYTPQQQEEAPKKEEEKVEEKQTEKQVQKAPEAEQKPEETNPEPPTTQEPPKQEENKEQQSKPEETEAF